MVDEVCRHRSDRAEPAVIEWRLAISLNFQENAVPHVQQHSASAVATAANALEDDLGPLPTVL